MSDRSRTPCHPRGRRYQLVGIQVDDVVIVVSRLRAWRRLHLKVKAAKVGFEANWARFAAEIGFAQLLGSLRYTCEGPGDSVLADPLEEVGVKRRMVRLSPRSMVTRLGNARSGAQNNDR